MILTEEEAKKKWCPMGRMVLVDDKLGPVAANRSESDAPYCNCLASGCMMWKWRITDDWLGFCGLMRG